MNDITKETEDYKSVEDLINTQVTRLDYIKRILVLINDKKHLISEFKEAFHLMQDIDELIDEGKRLVEKSNEITKSNYELIEEATDLCSQLDYVKDNLPDKFNKLSIADDPMSIQRSENYRNGNTIQNEPSSTASPNLPFIRQIDFNDGPAHGLAPKPIIKSEISYLTQSEFNSIPSYMRGRLTYDLLNSFIDKFNKCIVDKYAFLASYQTMTAKKRTDIDRFQMHHRSRCTKTKGKRFITMDELKNSLGGKLDKQTLNMIPMMRHTNRIQELRDGGIVRYIINCH